MAHENTMSEDAELFHGVEVDLLRDVIEALRSHYDTARMAVVYQETQTREYSLVGISNLRDVLSHIVSAIDTTRTPKQREESVRTMEEHLRRAIVEPYQTAAEATIDQFEDKLRRYIDDKSLRRFSKSGLALDGIEHDYNEALRLYEVGRNKKDRNLWDSEWEEAVLAFQSAVGIIKDLDTRLDHIIETASQNLFQVRLAVIGIVAGLLIAGVFFLLGRASDPATASAGKTNLPGRSITATTERE